jgi:hypothetical protein
VSIESPSMHVTARSYLTAGIAALGVGALVLAPVQPIPNQIALGPERVISTLAVELAASSIDPITPWVDTFTTAGANIGTLLEFYLQKPFPILQTIVANLGTYAAELENGQGDLIPEQIWGNVQTFFQAPWSPGTQLGIDAPPAVPDKVQVPVGQYASDTGPNSPKSLMLGLLLFNFLPEAEGNPKCFNEGECSFVTAAPILNFLNNHYSGQILGLLGTIASPFVQLVRSFTAIGEFFEAGDVIGAINELINIPAAMTNALLNGGGYLDLTAIVKSIVELPVDSIGVNLGGLLTPTPLNGDLADPDNPPTEFSGGIGLDGIAAVVESGLGPTTFTGRPLGWAGSVIGLGQFLGEQLVVTPPAPPTAAAEPAAAEPEASKQAAPLDIPAAALTEAPAEEASPAVVDIPAAEDESALAVAVVVADDPAPAIQDIAELEAAVEVAEASESEPAGAATPAAEDSGPEAAADSDKSGDDTDRSGGNDRRGAS